AALGPGQRPLRRLRDLPAQDPWAADSGRRPRARRRLKPARAGYRFRGRDAHGSRLKGEQMLWLILGIILLAIAIAGGAIVHPILFVLRILALVMFVQYFRGGRTAY